VRNANQTFQIPLAYQPDWKDNTKWDASEGLDKDDPLGWGYSFLESSNISLGFTIDDVIDVVPDTNPDMPNSVVQSCNPPSIPQPAVVSYNPNWKVIGKTSVVYEGDSGHEHTKAADPVQPHPASANDPLRPSGQRPTPSVDPKPSEPKDAPKPVTVTNDPQPSAPAAATPETADGSATATPTQGGSGEASSGIPGTGSTAATAGSVPSSTPISVSIAAGRPGGIMQVIVVVGIPLMIVLGLLNCDGSFIA
jgi:hypothetical protein